jgi:hypothetical protein
MQAGISLYACNYLNLPAKIMARTQGTCLGCGVSGADLRGDFRRFYMIPELHDIALQSPSRGASRLALFAILLAADEAGCCTASTERLAALAGCRRNHFSRAVQGLLAAGEVAVEPGRGPSRRNVYRILSAQSLNCEESHSGAEEPSAPPPAQPPAEDALDAVHRLRAEAWQAFDPNGRTWHHSSEAEREAFAVSEQGQLFLTSAEPLAVQVGISIAATGEIEPTIS